MAPTKAKVRKLKGVASTPLSKRTKRAGSKKQVIPLTVHQTSDDNVSVAMQDDFSPKLAALVKVVTDHSTRVADSEDRQRQGLIASTTSPLTSLPRQRARHYGELAPFPDVSEEVRRRVARRMRQVQADTGPTTEGDTSDDDDLLPIRWRKYLKSKVQLAQDRGLHSPQQSHVDS